MTEKTQCNICNRMFKDVESLAEHNKAKHPEPSSKENKSFPFKKMRNWGIFGLILGLIIWGMMGIIGSLGEYDEFAQCLTDSGTKVYGAYWCPACHEQEILFGRSYKKINYIECSIPNTRQQNALCNSEGIQSYPTWEFSDGSKIGGVLNIRQLSQITGCLV